MEEELLLRGQKLKQQQEEVHVMKFTVILHLPHLEHDVKIAGGLPQ